MKSVLLILSVLLLPVVASPSILRWGSEEIPKGKVKTIKCYLIGLGDSAKCCSNPSHVIYFDTEGRKVLDEVDIMGSKSTVIFEYDSLNRLTKETSVSWETFFYYNDSGNGNKLLGKKIRYPLGSSHPMETTYYTYKEKTLMQFKSFNEFRENYTCTVTDSNGAKIESYRTEGRLTEREETRYCADGSVAMTNSYSKYQDDDKAYYVVEQYKYEKYDEKGNWVKCKAIRNSWGMPVYWLYVREIEYYE